MEVNVSLPHNRNHGMLKVPLTEEVVEVNPWAVASGFFSVLSYHSTTSIPLFLQEPHWQDINQQQLGNCWFLASICSILNLPKGPELILNMMHEDQDHVIVRLFDSIRQAHYIKLKKSVIYNLTGSQYHAKMGSGLGSWPVFLEKALTAFDKDRNFAPQNAYYGRSVGGYGSEGLALLLGVDTMQLPISPPTVTTSDPLGKRFNFTMLMLFSGGFDIAVQGDQQTLSDIFGPTHANDWVTWKAWLLTKQPADLGVELWDKIVDKQTEIRIAWDRGKVWDTEIKHKLDGTFRVEHFQQWFTAKAGTLSPLLVQAVVAYVRRFGALAGKRGTGIYAVSQMNTFNYMYGLCTSGVPMTASTCHYIGKESKTSAKKTYSDEIIKGLVPNHEYTVLNVHSTNNLCYIQLLNPWGAVGRKLVSAVHSPHLHLPGHSAPVAESSGPFFDLDLDDFTKRFRCISHTVQKIRDPDK